MRSPNTIVISVRKSDKTIKVQEKFYRTLTQRFKLLNIPFVRGIINLFEMMVVGSKAINFSANEYVEEDEPKTKKRKNPSPTHKSLAAKIGETVMFLISLALAITLSIFLFKFLPLWITTALESHSQTIKENWILFNFIDGIIKTIFFVLYIYILSLIPSFRRIFEYHGAEHKSIFAYEKGIALTPKNAQKQSRFHPRCGTSFILIVFVTSILVYTFVPRQPGFTENLTVRLAFLPLIAGISYEYLKISARFAHQKWTCALVAPGLWLQRITTKEPTLDQLEVALNSLKIALKKESK